MKLTGHDSCMAEKGRSEREESFDLQERGERREEMRTAAIW